MNLVPIWASPSPVDFLPHLDLIAVDSFLASPGTGDSDPNLNSTNLVTLVLNGPHLDLVNMLHLGLIWTW